MATYRYRKDALKGLGVGPFLSEVEMRTEAIMQAEDSIPDSEYQANRLAKALHPKIQHVIVDQITDFNGVAKLYRVRPNAEKGTEKLAFFRAGMCVSVTVPVGGSLATRSYCLTSAPERVFDADGGYYEFCVAGIPPEFGGFASYHLVTNLSIGSELELSAPRGSLYHTPLRDADHVIGVALGTPTPFLSMAGAIVDGTEDYRLTLLYEHMPMAPDLLTEELDDMASRSDGRVRVVHFIPGEPREGFIPGQVDANMVRRWAGDEDYSVFFDVTNMSRQQALDIVAELGLPKRRWRIGPLGTMTSQEVSDALASQGIAPAEGAKYRGTIIIRGERQDICCAANETILGSIERAGIALPNHCRSGGCSVCRSRLIDGEVYVQETTDRRRAADVFNRWIHPCRTVPLSDFTLELPL